VGVSGELPLERAPRVWSTSRGTSLVRGLIVVAAFTPDEGGEERPARLLDGEDLGVFGGIVLLFQEVEKRRDAPWENSRFSLHHPGCPTANPRQVSWGYPADSELVVGLEIESRLLNLSVQVSAGFVETDPATNPCTRRGEEALTRGPGGGLMYRRHGRDDEYAVWRTRGGLGGESLLVRISTSLGWGGADRSVQFCWNLFTRTFPSRNPVSDRTPRVARRNSYMCLVEPAQFVIHKVVLIPRMQTMFSAILVSHSPGCTTLGITCCFDRTSVICSFPMLEGYVMCAHLLRVEINAACALNTRLHLREGLPPTTALRSYTAFLTPENPPSSVRFLPSEGSPPPNAGC